MRSRFYVFLVSGLFAVGACGTEEPFQEGVAGLDAALSPIDAGLEPFDAAIDTPDAAIQLLDAGLEPADAATESWDAAIDTSDASAETPDAMIEPPDAAVEPWDAALAPPDASTEAPDAAIEPPDASTPPSQLGPVQCRTNADCGSGACTRTAPGGICASCSDEDDCPTGTFECLYASCVRSCTGDVDCNQGMFCAAKGRCAIRSCPCPAPYVCGAIGLCERPACAGGSTCPAPLVCDGAICVEP